MTACPHCEQKTFGGLRKILIGPGRVVQCSSCGNKVGVKRVNAWLVLLPLVLAVIFGRMFESVAVQTGLNVFASLAGIIFYIFWVPLEKR